MRLRFSGRRALILGGSCELGVLLGRMLVSQQVTPILTYRSESGMRRINAGLKDLDRAFESIPFDLAEDAPGAALVRHLETGVDYLIDFAQEELEGLIASADPVMAKHYFRANIGARSEVIQLVARKMVASRKGRMVYISSTAAGCPNQGQGFYAAAKQAGEALYRNVGLELAGRGITTVTLRPGYVDAGRGRRYQAKQPDVISEMVPLGRALEPQEVTETILFLLSDSAVGINATVVTMDGGLTAGK